MHQPIDDLWKKWVEDTDPKAREELIEYYLPYVRRLARSYLKSLPTHLTIEDIEGAGVIGLIEAINRFSPDKGVPFEGFAAQRVRGAMTDSLRKIDWAPKRVRQQARQVKQAVSHLNHKHGRYPTQHEIAEYLGISMEELRQWDSLTEASSVDRLDLLLEDTNVEPLSTAEAPGDALVSMDLNAEVKEAMRKLSEQEQLVLFLYYERSRTMDSIAQQLGVTMSRISQVHAGAIAKLQKEVAA